MAKEKNKEKEIKKVKNEKIKKNRPLKKRLKRLIFNFKSIKWAKFKEVLSGLGSAAVFTVFFIALFGLVDLVISLIEKIF